MKILKFYFQKNKKIKTEYKKQLQNRLSGSGRGRLRRRRLRDRARTCQGERVRCESPRDTWQCQSCSEDRKMACRRCCGQSCDGLRVVPGTQILSSSKCNRGAAGRKPTYLSRARPWNAWSRFLDPRKKLSRKSTNWAFPSYRKRH